ncbi:MAG: EAL domain-containing protein [Vibrio sp.]
MKTINVSLRTAIIVPLLLVLLGMSCVLYYTQSMAYRNALEDVSQKELNTLALSVNSNLSNFLYPAFVVSSAMSESIRHQFMDSDYDSYKIISYLHDLFVVVRKKLPQLETLNVGLESNGYYYGFRSFENRMALMLNDETTDGALVMYDGSDINSNIVYRVHDFKLFSRPWYAPVAMQQKQMWSELYVNNDGRRDITISALSPILDNGKFLGVIGTDIKISTFNHFLVDQKAKHNRTIFIFDDKQQLIAQSSSMEQAFTDATPKTNQDDPTSISGSRRLISNSTDPVIKDMAQAYAKVSKQHDHVFQFTSEGVTQFGFVTEFKDEYGLNWNVAISIPESQILSKLSDQQKSMTRLLILATFILAILGFIFLTRITSPITRTAKAALRLSKRQWTTISETGWTFETKSLVNSFNLMAKELQNEFNKQHEMLAFDSLTHCYSREGIAEAVAQNEYVDGYVFVLAHDNFRDISDSLGYEKGDKLLVGISRILKDICPDNAYLARVTVHKFAIVIPQLQEDGKQEFVKKILMAFASPIKLEVESVLLAPRVGCCKAKGKPETGQWMRKASIALTHAINTQLKECIYSDEMEQISRKRTQTIVEITEGLKNDEFIPFYQPLIDLKTNAVIGAEALARWQSPQKGLVPPFKFIPIAEESGLIHQIGHQILLKSCQDTQREIDEGRWPANFHLHVNVAVAQLANEQFVYDLKQILETTRLEPKNLTLEVVESSIIDDNPNFMKNIEAIRKLNVGIAIDDFGTGYSSLAYLQSIPYDCLKIDRTFINALAKSNVKHSIVAAIMSMTREYDITIVAEGVETVEQAEILKELDCDQVQGFYFAKPMALDDWKSMTLAE